MRKDFHAPKVVAICNMCQGTGKVELLSLETGQKVWHDCLCQRKQLLTKSSTMTYYVDCG